jgi:CBS domain-containing protein
LCDRDCGCVPIIDDERLVGILTDRDLCMAIFHSGTTCSSIRICDVMAHKVITCSPDEPIQAAERRMRQHQVRRLPAVDANQRVRGILSINDLARASMQRGGGPTPQEVDATLAAICEPHTRAEAPST